VPKTRQTLFFSATMPKAIKSLADAYLTNPAEVSVTPTATTVDRIEQSVTFVNQAEKSALLTLYLQTNEIERALVFSRTKHGADKIVRQLVAAGIGANAIHGNKSQPQRERALAQFKSGQMPVLVATDIAARGIDIPGVSHVCNFDLPDVPEQYVHRIGRTARAGADGIAIAFCSPDERINLRDIERTTRQKLPTAALPEGFNAAVQALKSLKVAPSARDERAGGGRRDAGHGGHRRPSGPRVAIQPTGDRREGAARDGQPQRHPPRAGVHAGHRPDGGAAKRPFNRGRPGGGRPPARAQG
jgi:ATP-dependent RNA helicase RhlE